MDELPDRVERIDILRVEYGRRKICECQPPHYEVDIINHMIVCKDCGAIVDPFDAICNIAGYSNHLSVQVEALLEQRRKIENYKPHLVVIKNIERQYRNGLLPVCPNCQEPFDFLNIDRWVNKLLYQSREVDTDE